MQIMPTNKAEQSSMLQPSSNALNLSNIRKYVHYCKDVSLDLIARITKFIVSIFTKISEMDWPRPFEKIQNLLTIASSSKTENLSSIPVGLPNIYNSCYLNSVVQLLMTIDDAELKNILNSIKYPRLRTALCKVVEAMKTKGTTSNDLIPLMDMLRDALFNLGLPYFDKNNRLEQQDAHELLNVILQGRLVNFQNIKKADEDLGLKYRSKVTHEKMSMLSLPMARNKSMFGSLLPGALSSTDTLQQCVDRFGNEKSNSPENATTFISENGSEEKVSDYSTQMRINEAPKYLFLQMSRHDFSAGYAAKINSKVELPELIDLSSFATDKVQAACKGQLKYEPVSVIHHYGNNPESGHYTATVKRGNTWYDCNDSSVSKTEFKSIDNSNSYIVMLKAIQTHK